MLLTPVAASAATPQRDGGPGIANPPRSVLPPGANPAIVTGPDYPGALWEPASPKNYSVDNRPVTDLIQRLVIHVAEGNFAGTYQWFKNPAAKSSAHYVVASTGEVAQMVPEADIAWHAGNWPYNVTSVGIEHAGFTNSTIFPDTQYRGSARLAGYLAHKYLITPDRKHVIGHSQVPDPNHPGEFGGSDHHTDPGRTWNWPLYMAYLRMYAGTTYQQIVDSTTPSRITHKNGNWQYRLALPQTQAYDVFMRWSCTAPPKSVTVGVSTTGGYRAVPVNESVGCSRGWNRVGTFSLAGGDSWKLVVSKAATSANAIRVVEATDPVLPTAPQVSVNPGVGRIDVSWTRSTDNIGVGGYQLWVNSVRVYQGTALQGAATGLACNVTYPVSVRALDMISNRSPRDPLTATTAPCPRNPANLGISNVAQTSATLSWDSGGGTTDHFLTFLDGVQKGSLTTTSFTYTGLKCGTTHAFGVASVDSAGHVSTHVHLYATTLPC